jgi:hypothetical protein
MTDDILKRGDFVTATYEGRTVDAMVLIASTNGQSLFISFEAILGGHVGNMPVLRKDDGKYYSLIEDKLLLLTKKERP